LSKIFLVLLIFIVSSVYSQDMTWNKIYDVFNLSWPAATIETYDHGYIVTGKSNMTIYNQDMFLIRTNNTGNVIWYHTYGGSFADGANSIVQTLDNKYIIVGNSNSFGDTLNSDMWIVNVDDSGETVWAKTYGNKNVTDVGTSIQSTSDTNYIISFTSNDSVGIMKINQSGDKIWSRLLDNGQSFNVIQVSDGGYAILYNKYFTDIQASGFSFIITDSTGSIITKKEYKEFPSSVGNSIQKTSDNGFAICAYDGNILLIKLDVNGVIQWSKRYNGRLDYYVVSFRQTKNNGFVIAGWEESNQSILIYRLSESGQIIWMKSFNGAYEDISGAIITTSDDGYLISGYTNSFDNNKRYQTILIKTDSLGSNLTDKPTGVNIYRNNSNQYIICQNYPNPFNPITNIEYSIPKTSFVTLKVFDLLGREIRTLVNKEKAVGTYHVSFDASNLSSGIYLYRLQSDNFIETKKLIFIK